MRTYLVVAHGDPWPDGWHGLGLIEAHSLTQAKRKAGARWLRGPTISIMPTRLIPDTMPEKWKRWLAEARQADL